MNATLKAWLIGAANAGISGAAAAAGSFAAGITFKQGAIIVGISAAVSLAKWIPQHPIPGGTQ
jgi:hypothetical protein